MGLGGLWAFFSLVNLWRMDEREIRVALMVWLCILGNLLVGEDKSEQTIKVDNAAHGGKNIFGEEGVR